MADTPRTEAGKRLLKAMGQPFAPGTRAFSETTKYAVEAILAIEAEAALNTEAPETLDAAWAEAEAALPDGMALRLHGSIVRRGEAYYAEAIEDLTAQRTGHGWNAVEDTVGDSPAAALRALATRLRGTPE